MRDRLIKQAERKIEKLANCVYTARTLPAELMDHAVGGHVSDAVWIKIPYDWGIYRSARQKLAEQGWEPIRIYEGVEPGSRVTTLKNDDRRLLVTMSPKQSSSCELEVISEEEVTEIRRKYRVVCG